MPSIAKPMPNGVQDDLPILIGRTRPPAPPPPTYSADKPKESARIQTLRGIACLLLVAFHVVGNPGVDGLRISGDSIYRTFVDAFAHLRMPLFTFLSGFVYAYRPVSPRMGWNFATKKARRLLIPLIVVSTIFFCIQALTPGTNADSSWTSMWRIYVFPYAHFWFLQAIVLIFAAVAFLDHQQLMTSFGGYLIVFALSLFLHFTVRSGFDLFSLQRALHLAPFFFLGLGANRFMDQLWAQPVKLICGIAFALTMTDYVIACVYGSTTLPERTSFLATTLSISGCLTLMYFVPRIWWLAWVGGFSFTVYLYHVFFTAGTRIALNLLGSFPVHLHFAAGLLAGIVGPILLETMLRESAFARRTFLGQS